MAPLLPPELLELINTRYPCRRLQTRQLASLLLPSLPSPRTLVVHGTEATGKTAVSSYLLAQLGVPYAIIKSQECITARHLLEKTVAGVEDALEELEGNKDKSDATYGRCENMAALVEHLQRLLSRRQKFILLFDGIDKQREAPPTLLAALARLGEIIPAITTILIVTHPDPTALHTTGVPHIHFPAYTRAEALHILSLTPLPIFPRSRSPSPSPSSQAVAPPRIHQTNDDDLFVWTRYLSLIYDSLSHPASRSLLSFRSTAAALWPSFVSPIVAGEYGTRDFSKLLITQRHLFQNESVLVDRIVPHPSLTHHTIPTKPENPIHTTTTTRQREAKHDLPTHTKYLLCAAYLASHNPPRKDLLHFSSLAPASKRGRGAAKHRLAKPAATKHKQIQRTHLPPSPFGLERWLAIYAAILPRENGAKGGATADLLMQMATLGSLRLVVRTSAVGGGEGGGGVLSGEGRWRVNVGWEFVRELARGVGFEIEERVWEG